ncbi:MAG: hypothetical protein LBO80_04910 [Treponema sp.]|jgi:hypothetical protein|nr:hypothetical protein [Treponema sp.]
MILNAADRMTAIEVVRLSTNPDPFMALEYLIQKNEILLDMPQIQCNQGTEHTILLQLENPKGMHRTYYEGTKTVSTQTKTKKQTTTMVEAWAEVDEVLAKDSGSPDQLRNHVAGRVITGMGLAQAQELIYGKRRGAAENNDSVDGFATRLAKVDNENVFSMGGTGTNLTSLYLAALGESFCHMIYPQHSDTLGIERIDWGRQTALDKNGNQYAVLKDQFRVRYGLAIPNPFAVKRIANIAPDTDAGDLVDKVLAVMRRMPSGAHTYVMYANYTVQDIFDKAARDKPNVMHNTTDPWGNPVNTIREFRIRTVEAIRDDEPAAA